MPTSQGNCCSSPSMGSSPPLLVVITNSFEKSITSVTHFSKLFLPFTFIFLLLIPPFSAVFTQKVYKKERALVNTFFLNGVLPYLNGSILFFALVFSQRRDEQNGEREHAFLRRDIDFAVVLFHDVFY